MNTMDTPAIKADHRPYVEAVRAKLLRDDLAVGPPEFNTGAVRSAVMSLLPPDDDADEPWHPTFAGAQSVALRWNEEVGWSLLALHTHGDEHLPTIWRHGLGLVHPPATVRAWLALLLTTPAFAPSRDDAPYRTHQQHDPSLEAVLAVYAP